MAKLSNADREQIILLYAQGNVTQAELAKKFNVSTTAIAKLLAKGESCEKVKKYEEKVYKSMQEFLESQQGTVQALIHDILVSVQGDIKGAKLRDKMGALKILVEAFDRGASAAEQQGHEIVFKIVGDSVEHND